MNALSAREHVDFLVLGGGVAGLSFALEAASHGGPGRHEARARRSTQYAQGGIAAVLGPDDDFELHVQDTLVAGAGLCHARWSRSSSARGRSGSAGSDRAGRGVRRARPRIDSDLTREGGH